MFLIGLLLIFVIVMVVGVLVGSLVMVFVMGCFKFEGYVLFCYMLCFGGGVVLMGVGGVMVFGCLVG